MEDWKSCRQFRKNEAKKYLQMTPSEKVAYNLQKINLELKKMDASFQKFSEPKVSEIKSYIKQNQIASDCGQGRDFCLDCGLNEIELNLDKE